MQVGMMEQVLTPSVKYGEKADLGAQVLGISGDGEQGLRRGPEQDAIELSLIFPSSRLRSFLSKKHGSKYSE